VILIAVRRGRRYRADAMPWDTPGLQAGLRTFLKGESREVCLVFVL